MDEAATRQYLTFALGGERFAVQSLLVSEVLDMPALTRVPLGPPCLRGIVNLRGNAATVVDLSEELGLGVMSGDRGSCLIIVDHAYDGEHALVGIMTDAVQEVVEIPPSDVERTPEMGLSVDPRFLAGLARLDGEFVMLLDPERILALDELSGQSALGADAG